MTASCHSPTFDRLVFRARSGTPGYDVRYVRRIVADGSGLPVPLAGTQRIRIVLRPRARAHERGREPDPRGSSRPAVPTFARSRAPATSRASSPTALGLRRRTGFRVFRLTSPTRVVVDVRH